MTDSFEVILQNVRALCIINAEKLAFIESQKNHHMINSFSCKKRKIEVPNHTLSFTSKDRSTDIEMLIKNWKYDGKKLKKESIIVNDFIDTKLKVFEDLSRLQLDYLRLIDIYARLLKDEPESRNAVNILFTNMKLLREAIESLNEQITHPIESSKGEHKFVRDSKAVLENLKKIASRSTRPFQKRIKMIGKGDLRSGNAPIQKVDIELKNTKITKNKKDIRKCFKFLKTTSHDTRVTKHTQPIQDQDTVTDESTCSDGCSTNEVSVRATRDLMQEIDSIQTFPNYASYKQPCLEYKLEPPIQTIIISSESEGDMSVSSPWTSNWDIYENLQFKKSPVTMILSDSSNGESSSDNSDVDFLMD